MIPRRPVVRRFLAAVASTAAAPAVGALAVAACVIAAPLGAQPVALHFTGRVNGDWNDVSFSDRSFRITLTGDLAQVRVRPDGSGATFAPSAATVEVEAHGTADFLTPPTFFVTRLGEVGFAVDGRSTLALLPFAGLVGWELDTPAGPVTSAAFYPGFRGVPTTAGTVSFHHSGTMTFAGGPVSTTVPEPRGAALVAAGLLATGLARGARRRGVARR